MACRHCGRDRVNRPRGLCWSCYYTPGVRERYPSTSKFAKRGVGNGNGAAPLPAAPTRARPGSPEKVAVLEQRARHRQALWHPQDAPMDAESSTPQHKQEDTRVMSPFASSREGVLQASSARPARLLVRDKSESFLLGVA